MTYYRCTASTLVYESEPYYIGTQTTRFFTLHVDFTFVCKYIDFKIFLIQLINMSMKIFISTTLVQINTENETPLQIPAPIRKRGRPKKETEELAEPPTSVFCECSCLQMMNYSLGDCGDSRCRRICEA